MNSKIFLLAALLALSLTQIILPPPPSIPNFKLPVYGQPQPVWTPGQAGQTGQTCCSDKTITVYGQATVQANPDTATLSAQIVVNGATVNQAITLLSAQVSTVISILTANGINGSNYQTSSLNVYPNTSFSNGASTVVGQIATESFTITIPNINPSGANVGKLIDDLASVNGIIINGLSFDLKDKTNQLALARTNAFTNAQNKAIDYTTSLQLSLGQIVTIIDSYSSAPLISGPIFLENANQALAGSSLAPTTVNVGTIAISYNLQAIYSYA